MWNLKYDTNISVKEKQNHGHKEQIEQWLSKGRGLGEG